MRWRAFIVLVLLFTLQSLGLRAQAAHRPEPRFSLHIFDASVCGTNSMCYRALRVVETNTSKEPLVEQGCLEFQGAFHISVLYNGGPLEERDESARKTREEDAKRVSCNELAYNEVDPGETLTYNLAFGLDYPLAEPGSYEITVSRESDPEHPDKSVRVKSNTITIVVPEPKQAETK